MPDRRLENWLDNRPAVRDERHEEAEHGAQDCGRDLAVFHMHPDEHQALDRQDRGSQDRQRRPPMKRGGDDEPDRAYKLEDAERDPGLPRHRSKGRNVMADLVQHEHLHDARRSVQERGEGLQDP